jgi:hypothetical protein
MGGALEMSNNMQALVSRWLTEGLNLQHKQAEGGYLRAVGSEREKCARELARVSRLAITIAHRDDLKKRTITVRPR